MQKTIQLKMLPLEAAKGGFILEHIAEQTGENISKITGFHIIKKSLDARSKTVWVNLTVNAFISEPFIEREIIDFVKILQSAAIDSVQINNSHIHEM